MSQFRKIPHIPTDKKLADMIFSRLKQIKIDPPKSGKKRKSDYSFSKTLYFKQFRYLFPELEKRLAAIVESFPIIDDLHPFHKELIDVLFGIEKLQTSLSRIKHTQKALRSIEREVSRKLGQSTTADEAKRIKNETIGRVGSTIKNLREPLNDLINAKIQLIKVPDFNLSEKTIAFAGAPNAGKSSFVRLISTGKPEIASYPFTTKELICGHLKNKFESIQLIDTPGLLDRSLHERNPIEMRSILALKHFADLIVFLFDPTKDSPLTLEQQVNLNTEIKTAFPNVPIVDFVNKSDTLTNNSLKEILLFVGEIPLIATIESKRSELERIIQELIDKIPIKQVPLTHKELEVKEEQPRVSVNKDKIEWIFFDDNTN